MHAFADPHRQLAGRAAAIPARRLGIMMNSEPQGRDSGLVVTREDIFKIKHYEKSAFALPANVAALQVEAGVGRTGLDGLELSDIVAVYARIRQHAGTWRALESDIKSTSTQLHIFAGKFRRNGDAVLSVVNAMDIIDQLNKKVGDLVLNDLVDFSGQSLSDKDKRLKGSLVTFLEWIKRDIETQRAHVERVKAGTGQFAKHITQVLIPAVNEKIVLARTYNLHKVVEKLDAELKEVDRDIASKKAEYDTLVKKSLKYAAAFPFGLVNAGIYGAKAERARKDKNQLIRERDALHSQLRATQPLIGAVDRLSAGLRDIDFRLVDAEEGASNLRDMWLLMHEFMDISAGCLYRIDDSKSLFEFVIEFSLVLNPWVDIEEQAFEFSVLFHDAINDWQREAGR
ncbi:alpha-xenorhabdolysin family binary toxin subunit A [Pseudomonas putida]